MSKIGEFRIQTESGTESVPIYEEGTSGDAVRECIRVQTENNTGFVPVVDVESSDKKYLRVHTSNHGTQALHSEPTLVIKNELGGEEDGDASEWSGNTGFISATSSPTVSNSSYALQMYTNGKEQSVTKSIPGTSDYNYNYFSFYIYMHDDGNNEFNMWDGGYGGNQVFGLYFRPRLTEGIYWSAEGVRDGGSKLIDENNVNYGQWYHIEYRNIDYANNELDIYINGDLKGTYGFIQSGGEPDTLYLSSNLGNYEYPTFSIDKIEGKEK